MSFMQDQKSVVKVEHSVPPQVINTDTDTTGSIIDLQGFDSATLLLQSGTITLGDYTAKIQHGEQAGGGDMADAAADDLLGDDPDLAVTDDDVVKRQGYIGGMRYIRVVVTSQNSANGLIAASFLLGNPAHAPVA